MAFRRLDHSSLSVGLMKQRHREDLHACANITENGMTSSSDSRIRLSTTLQVMPQMRSDIWLLAIDHQADRLDQVRHQYAAS